MPQHFPPEIWDLVLDHLHNNPYTLKEYSLVSRSWAYHAQKHLLNKIEFRDESQLLRWEEDFLDLSKSPAPHTKFLYFSHATGITKAHLRVIGSFTNVTHLKVWANDSCYKPGSLNVLHNLLPAVKSLCVCFESLHLSHLFALVGLSRSIKDLDIQGWPNTTIIDDGDAFLTSPLPEFTGTLALSCDLNDITGPLLRLPPNSLRFRKIVWMQDSPYDESRVRHMADLIERCSDTLEYIDFDFTIGAEKSAPTPPIDLSKATKLKGVAIRLDEDHIEWFTKSLEKISPGQEGFEQILIRFSFTWDDRWSEAGKERIKQCNALENILVRLSEPENFRVKAVWRECDWFKGEQPIRRDLFPEMIRREKMEVVRPKSPDLERLLVLGRYLRFRRYNESENGIGIL